MKHVLLYTLCGLLALSCSKTNQPDPATSEPESSVLSTRTVADGLTQPWSIVFGPDNQVWTTERAGRLLRIDPVSGQSVAVQGIPSDIVQRGEGGLLGFALHPDFPNDPRVYFAYDYVKQGNYTGRIVSYTYRNNQLSGAKILVDDIPAAGNHNGSRLAFGPDKNLYFSTGDAARPANAQDRASLSGKIMRITADGGIPSDNPVAGSPVFSFGHRNPQGLVWVNNKLFSSEHGDTTDDEINIILSGRNYGWPNVQGTCAGSEAGFCTENNVAEPIYTWTPTIAPSGMAWYDSDAIPQWKNSLLLATLKGSRLVQLKLNAGQTAVEDVKEFYTDTFGRLRDICLAPDGRVFVITGNGSGDKLIEIKRN